CLHYCHFVFGQQHSHIRTRVARLGRPTLVWLLAENTEGSSICSGVMRCNVQTSPVIQERQHLANLWSSLNESPRSPHHHCFYRLVTGRLSKQCRGAPL